ncbi:right-handed parallel beta-helix repeat-containing protein [Chitinophaga rhizophila]|uniref:Right-handed parallel beta-helix repeat-containing protein n=1 Tax=Chitinophaga rhizophila TaxID=2866212 RepID=A0ABS7GAA2_9BACT|nr:right-handed parallel beta-helix repeat-containing protein [Chitinophaga rhizophila]MBW8684588.1 right-handed parallel beta-helix repeat-containing protein [Chitinophaga rhizophila]
MIVAALLSLVVSYTAGPTLAPNINTPLFSLTDTLSASSREHVLVADKNGRLVIDNKKNTYRPGDILLLKGTFKSVLISNLSGTAQKPIIIRNYRSTTVKIGEPGWNGGSWSVACELSNCHYIRIGSMSDRNQFVINGSVQAAREAYRALQLGNKTDNVEVCFLTIQNGGNGIVAKTDPVKGDPSTAYPKTYIRNLSIHDLTITDTKNEAMYIGHTATYWDHTVNQPYYGSPSKFATGHDYVQPIKWQGVKIYNNLIKNSGLDGIQTAAIDGLEIYNNEIVNWGTQHNAAHNGGILIGGRTTNTNTHDNYVHDGWGEFCQFYGSGENNATHIISNNLFINNQSDGISMRGTDNAIVRITNNTVAGTKGNSLRINGYTGMKGKQIVNANIFISPNGGRNIGNRNYVYVEVGGDATEGSGDNENKKFADATAAGVNTREYYRPAQGKAGYRRN